MLLARGWGDHRACAGDRERARETDRERERNRETERGKDSLRDAVCDREGEEQRETPFQTERKAACRPREREADRDEALWGPTERGRMLWGSTRGDKIFSPSRYNVSF